MATLGIDIGGSGIKGAIVDTKKGVLISDRIRIPTPEKSKPTNVAKIIRKIAKKLDYSGVIGAGYPGVVKNGITCSAANIHEDWVGCDAASLITDMTGCKTMILNDADAAGLGEMRFGLGKKEEHGLVLFLTIGTGIGSAFFIDGKLIPNFELGHLEVHGKEAEHRASDATRQVHKMDWKDWGKEFTKVLRTYEKLFNPDLIILGGGISTKFGTYKKYLKVDTKIIPAKLENLAGIIGAAMAAEEFFRESK